jgi:hypothetical protein
MRIAASYQRCCRLPERLQALAKLNKRRHARAAIHFKFAAVAVRPVATRREAGSKVESEEWSLFAQHFENESQH